MSTIRLFSWAVFAMFVGSTAAAAQLSPGTPVATNDNLRAAGTASNNLFAIRLVADRGGWRPEGPDGPELAVAAFGEEGGSLQVPGPIIRLAPNSEVVVSVRNALGESLFVHGLFSRPATKDDVLEVLPGETREKRFVAGAPGTYHYWATTGTDTTITARKAFDTQLGGAFIIDPVTPSNDRVFVITEWISRGSTTAERQRLFTINGRSWPFTERLSTNVGETSRWRWVNLTTTSHPMHLHGFYFRVAGVGSGLEYRNLERANQPEVVTQNMATLGTMEMSWTPDRSGQWLLHCHVLGHISPDSRFWAREQAPHQDHSTHDMSQAMAGMVMGITVNGNARVQSLSELPARHLTLAMYRRPRFWDGYDAYAFALKEGDDIPPADTISVPGPPVILTRGQPVEITVRNEMPDATSVHWHGIELDSYYDGVAGFSGTPGSTTPLIGAGESFKVRFTPPRAGTFIYHTHSHDNLQLASGLYGALIVLEPGETYDPALDHLLVVGSIGPIDGKNPNRLSIVVNGKGFELNAPEGPKPRLRFKAGMPNRIRLINITPLAELSVSLLNGSGALEWTPVKKDGADVPASERAPRPARDQVVAIGETYDFIITPRQGGPTWLEVRYAPTGMWIQQVPVAVEVAAR